MSWSVRYVKIIWDCLCRIEKFIRIYKNFIREFNEGRYLFPYLLWKAAAVRISDFYLNMPMQTTNLYGREISRFTKMDF